MTTPTIFVATWRKGLFILTGDALDQELADQLVRGLTADGNSGVLALVGGRSLRRRTAGGESSTIATSEFDLSCCVAVGDAIYVGTDDARVLRVEANGTLEQLTGFDTVAGRDKWYAGSAVINGRVVGPPLGIRSITATCDGAVILANVHVGGIPRSTDGGVTWHPTIDIDSDVHEVCAHPTRPNIVIAAAAIGLCVSKDGGATWAVEREGLHASYCSAVAFAGDDILVAASADHFASQGAIYRRPIDGGGALLPVGGGLPRWLEGIADTAGIATRGSTAAVIDRAGNLYVSDDAGGTWARCAHRVPASSSLLIR
jgi:photosystem II stability/assembly factor-like uncharacterized protein